jgi:hypothetical protein
MVKSCQPVQHPARARPAVWIVQLALAQQAQAVLPDEPRKGILGHLVDRLAVIRRDAGLLLVRVQQVQHGIQPVARVAAVGAAELSAQVAQRDSRGLVDKANETVEPSRKLSVVCKAQRIPGLETEEARCTTHTRPQGRSCQDRSPGASTSVRAMAGTDAV